MLSYRPMGLEIAIRLKEENKAFKVEKYEHNYPHCWRTDKPVLYYPLDSWFVRTTAMKERMIELNNTINWKPGSTGTGKSTTLASMIDFINTNRAVNIISLEDPIEFVHRSKKSQVIQREVGTHVPSFAEGVRAAMREDPDVILVGELRDEETISMAMTAAETGHLVLGTLHTTSAVKTLDRVVDALPSDEREQTKSFLSQSLIAVLSQFLIRTPDGRGRKAIVESLVMTKAIAKLIMTDQTHQIPAQLQTGRDKGMQLLDQALLLAIQAKEIDPDDAYNYAVDKKQFQRFVTDTSILPKIDLADS